MMFKQNHPIEIKGFNWNSKDDRELAILMAMQIHSRINWEEDCIEDYEINVCINPT